MGVIKQTSDNVIIDNESELITPKIVRQVNDVIDAQVEAANTSIITIQENITTLNSGVIPNGGATGQVLAKNSNTDKDTAWVDMGSASDALPLSGGTMTGGINLGNQETHGAKNIWFENDEGLLIGLKKIQRAEESGTVIDLENYTIVCSNPNTGGNFPLRYLDAPTLTTEGDIAHKGYVDEKALPVGGTTGQILAKNSNTNNDVTWIDAPSGNGGNFLPITGGTMEGDINIAGNSMTEVSYIGGLVSSIDLESGVIDNIDSINSNDGTTFLNLSARSYSDAQSRPFGYAEDYSANYTARSLVDKAYVDSKTTREYVHAQFTTGADPQVVNIPHGLNTKKIMVIIKYGSNIIVYPNRLINVTDTAFDYTFDADERVNVTVIALP